MSQPSKLKIDDTAIVARLKKRDSGVLEILYDSYGPPLYGLISRIVRHEKIAIDVLQKTFNEIWEKIDQYNPEKLKFFTWIMNIARGLAKEQKSFKTENSSQNLNVAQSESGIDLDKLNQYDRQVSVILAQLSTEHQQIISLMYLEGNSYREVISKLGLPENEAKALIHSAIKKLREILQSKK